MFHSTLSLQAYRKQIQLLCTSNPLRCWMAFSATCTVKCNNKKLHHPNHPHANFEPMEHLVFLNKVIISVSNYFKYFPLYNILRFKACLRNVLSFCIVPAIWVPKSFHSFTSWYVQADKGLTGQFQCSPLPKRSKISTNTGLYARLIERAEKSSVVWKSCWRCVFICLSVCVYSSTMGELLHPPPSHKRSTN